MQPELDAIREEGMEFYLVVAGQDRELKAFFELNPLPAAILWDKDFKIFEDYNIKALPTTVFVDKAGFVRETKLGWGKGSLQELSVLVSQLTSE